MAQQILKNLGAVDLGLKAIKDIKSVLHVKFQDTLRAAPKIQTSNSPTVKRPLVVNGELFEMDEGTIIALVRLNFFTVVWPGTEIDLNISDKTQTYPPHWISPHIPQKVRLLSKFFYKLE